VESAEYDFDLLVSGSGPGGQKAHKVAALDVANKHRAVARFSV
jgi:hypothetical protein